MLGRRNLPLLEAQVGKRRLRTCSGEAAARKSRFNWALRHWSKLGRQAFLHAEPHNSLWKRLCTHSRRRWSVGDKARKRGLENSKIERAVEKKTSLSSLRERKGLKIRSAPSRRDDDKTTLSKCVFNARFSWKVTPNSLRDLTIFTSGKSTWWHSWRLLMIRDLHFW